MPINTPETDQAIAAQEVARQGDFSARNLPSPGALPLPQTPIFGTGEFQNNNPEQNNAAVPGTNVDANFLVNILGVKDKPFTVGKLPSYSQQEVYNPRYKEFLPGADNEERAAAGQSTADKWANSLIKFGATAVGTFYNGMTALPNSLNLIKGNNVYTDPNSVGIQTWMDGMENKFPNYYKKWEKDHPFLSALPFSGGFANFWGDQVLKNLGFTVGAIASAAVQDFIIGGLTGGVGEIPLIGNQVGKAAQWINKIFSGGKIAELGTELGAATGAITTMENLKRVGAMSKLWDGTRYALNSYAAAASEAGFEARDGYNTTKNDLTLAYRNEKGYDPSGKDADDIEEAARTGANVRFGINLVLLGLSNAVQFDSFLKPYSVARNGARSTIEKSLAEDAGRVGLKTGDINTWEHIPTEGRFGKVYNWSRPYLANVLSEGVYEEGGQYAAQIGTQNYYQRKFIAQHSLSPKGYQADQSEFDQRDDVNELLHSTIAGLGAEFGTEEGWQNIFLGALTGVLTGGGKEAYDRFKGIDSKGQHRAEILGFLNRKGVTDTLENLYDSTVKSTRIAADMKASVVDGDLFKFKNYKHEMFTEFITSGLRAGKFDARMEQLDLLKDMQDDKFKAAWGMDKSEADTKTVSEYVDLMKQKAVAIKNSWNLINDTFSNPFNRYSKNQEEKDGYENYENWKSDLTYLSSIQKDVRNRQTSIDNQVKKIDPRVSMTFLRTITDRKALVQYSKVLAEQAKTLVTASEVKESTTKQTDAAEAKYLQDKVDNIAKLLIDPKPSNEAYQKLFNDLLHHEIHGYVSPIDQVANPKVDVAAESIPALINYGRDSNRLSIYADDAKSSFELLATQRGVNKYFADILKGKQAWRARNPVPGEQSTYTDNPLSSEPQVATETPEETVTPSPSPVPRTLVVKSTDNKKSRTFDEGTYYFLNTGKEQKEKVKVLGENPDGTIVVENENGEKFNITKEQAVEEDKNPIIDDIDQELRDTTSDNDPPPPTDEQNAQLAKPVGGSDKKDVATAAYATIGPEYHKTTDFNNFERRHSDFLWNMQSLNPERFNQENRSSIKAIFVNKDSATKMGFPDNFIDNKQFTGDNEPIRIVYVLKRGNDSFFVDGKGNPLSNIKSGTVDPNLIIFSTALGTSFNYSDGSPRFTNVSNLDKDKLLKQWINRRRQILAYKGDIGNLQAMSFSVSGGIPNISDQNYNRKNSVVKAGLIESSDLDRPIIAVSTLNYITPKGVGDVSSTKDGINITSGKVKLSTGFSTSWLNARKISHDEAVNIYNLLLYISSTVKDKDSSAMFRYMRGVINMTSLTHKNGTVKKPLDSSIVLDKKTKRLYLGKDRTDSIYMQADQVVLNKDRIIAYLENSYHNVDNTKLTKFDPKEKFNVLKVVDNKIVTDKTFDNYQHYLLSDANGRTDMPLTTNFNTSDERNGEPPFIQNYSVLDIQDANSFDEPASPSKVTTQANPEVAEIEKQIINNQKRVTGRTEDNEFYIIDGEKYKRVTNAIGNDFTGDTKKYEDARQAGYTIDDIVRDFFGRAELKKPEGITQEAYDKLIKQLGEVKATITSRGERFLTNNIVLFDEKSKTAGEVDILSVDKNGKFSIYDIKSSKDFSTYDVSYGGKTKRKSHQQQLSTYANIFQNQYGKPITKMGILPIEVVYDSHGKISYVNKLAGIPVEYSSEVNDIVPLKGTEKAPIITPPPPVTTEKEPEISSEDLSKLGDAVDLLTNKESIVHMRLGGISVFSGDLVKNNKGEIINLTPIAYKDLKTGVIDKVDNTLQTILKEGILDALKKARVTKDQTNTPKAQSSREQNKDFQVGTENNGIQYRTIYSVTNNNYQKIDIDREYSTFRHVVGDRYTLSKVDHILRKTNGGFAWGAVQNAMLYIYTNAPIGTLYHEAFESVWGNYLSGKEQQELYDEFKGRRGTFVNDNEQTVEYSKASLREAKEQMGEDFVQYRLNKDKAGEALKSTPKLLQWFNNLVNFIKKIIFGRKDQINDLFNRMNQGYYRNYNNNIKNIDEPQYSTARTQQLQKFPEYMIQDTIQGMTVNMFQQMAKEGADIIDLLEERQGETANILYSNLYNRIENYYEGTDADSLRYATKVEENKLKDKIKEGTATDQDIDAIWDMYDQTVKQWNENIKPNWKGFVVEHKKFLKIFSVRFNIDDDGNVTFNEETGDNKDETTDKGKADYAVDYLTIDAKNSASSVVKMLIASVSDSIWKDEESTNIDERKDNSSVGLAKGTAYAKLFNYILHISANIGNVYEVIQNLYDRNADIDTRKLIDANVQRLLNKLKFNNGFKDLSYEQSRLILKLEGAIVKNKPDYDRQLMDQTGSIYYKQSQLNTGISQQIDKYLAGIAASGVLAAGNSIEAGVFHVTDKVINGKRGVDYLQSIGIDISKKEVRRLKNIERSKLNEAANGIKGVLEKAHRSKQPIQVVSGQGIDFAGRLSDLAEVYVNNISGDDTQSQHPNLDNEQTSSFITNNFVITQLNDLNNSATKEEFLSKAGNSYMRDIFHQDSYILNKLFDPKTGKRILDSDGNPTEVRFTVVEGLQKWNGDNTSAKTFTAAVRRLFEINNNNNGTFYTLLPADSTTENAVKSGTFLDTKNYFGTADSYAAEKQRFYDQMYSWLISEINLARDFNVNKNRQNIAALNEDSGYRKVGNSLRFFADILAEDDLESIYKQLVDPVEVNVEQEIGNVISRVAFATTMADLVTRNARENIDFLKDWEIFNDMGNNRMHVAGLDKGFLKRTIGENFEDIYDEDSVVELMEFREMNYIISNIDMHKMFFSDPAQYKDELKRIKSFLSGRDYTHVDIYEGTDKAELGFNSNATISRNFAGQETKPNEKVNLKPGDPGYKVFSNNWQTSTFYDVRSASNNNREDYGYTNEPDSQAYISMTAYRELMMKAAGRWTNAMERVYQQDMAWMRQELAKEKRYTYTDENLRKMDEKLAAIEEDSRVAFQGLKIIHSGVQDVNGTAVASLDKASWQLLNYRWFKGKTLGKLTIAMQEKGLDYVRMKSAHKVGTQNNSLTSFYDDEGNFNEKGIQGIEKEQISLKYLGIQVEQAKKERGGQREGSQGRKIVTMDTMANGVPKDLHGKITEEDWNKLDQKEKIKKSPLYAKVRRFDSATSSLVEIRTNGMMRKLGFREKLDENGELEGYHIPDKTKVSKFILRELERRELPRNIAYGLETAYDTTSEENEFKVPIEANAQYQKIRQIIYSVIESTVQRPKFTIGGQKTMVSVTGMESGQRIVKKMVNDKPVFTSDLLKFYIADDKGTQACEIMLPYWFEKEILKAQHLHGATIRTRAEVLAYLKTEEGKELLKGIGFRIPTQGLNSLDFFVVKDFLPANMGDSVVFPAEITTKAGSDFDIDKMNIYLKNFYIDHKTGFPKIVKSGLEANIDTNDEEKLRDYWKRHYSDAYDDYVKFTEPALAGASRFMEAVLNKGKAPEVLQKKGIKTKSLQDLSTLMDSGEEDFDEFDDEEYVPSEDEFVRINKGKPSGNILSKQAAENEYIDAMHDLLSDPLNYDALTKPNSAANLKELRTKIVALHEQREEDFIKGQKYGRLINSAYMSAQRQTYLSSKAVVGIAAIANTFHSLSQGVQGSLLYWGRQWDGFKIKFPHNYVEKNGIKIPSLSGMTLKGFDVNISTIISQVIDGGVDVTNDPFLAEMGINRETLPVFLSLVRTGVSPMNIVSFINQPIIQEYLRRKAINDSVSGNISHRSTKYATSALVNPVQADPRFKEPNQEMLSKPDDSNYSITEMHDMIKAKNLTSDQRARQWQMLDDYLNYVQMGWDLFNFYQGYNWDTGNFGDPNMTRLKELARKRADLLESRENKNALPMTKVSNLLNGTFLGTMRQMTFNLHNGFTSIIRVQRGVAGEFLTRLSKQMSGWYVNIKLKQKALLRAELSMIDYSMQNDGKFNSIPLVDQMGELLMGNKTTAHYIDALQKLNVKRINENPFIKNLTPLIDERDGFPSTVILKDREYDTYTSNVWTDSFREMKDDNMVVYLDEELESDPKTVGEIYDMLVKTFILQFGGRRSSNSATHLIPNDTYEHIAKSATTVMNLTNFEEVGSFYRNNVRDNNIVPEVFKDYRPIDDQGKVVYNIPEDWRFVDNIKLHAIIKAEKGDKVRVKLFNPSISSSKNRQFIKVYNEGTERYELYQRVDIATIEGTEPLQVEKYRTLYKQVNIWGNGNRVQEHHRFGQPSVLSGINAAVVELTDDYIISALSRAGIKSNASVETVEAAIALSEAPINNDDSQLSNTSEADDQGDSGNSEEAPKKTISLERFKQHVNYVIESMGNPRTPTGRPKFMEIKPEDVKRSSKKGIFNIASEGEVGEQEGYPLTVKGHPELQLYVSKEDDIWHVADQRTGYGLNSRGTTAKDAIATMVEILNKFGGNPNINAATEEKLAKLGLQRRYDEPDKELPKCKGK